MRCAGFVILRFLHIYQTLKDIDFPYSIKGKTNIRIKSIIPTENIIDFHALPCGNFLEIMRLKIPNPNETIVITP